MLCKEIHAFLSFLLRDQHSDQINKSISMAHFLHVTQMLPVLPVMLPSQFSGVGPNAAVPKLPLTALCMRFQRMNCSRQAPVRASLLIGVQWMAVKEAHPAAGPHFCRLYAFLPLPARRFFIIFGSATSCRLKQLPRSTAQLFSQAALKLQSAQQRRRQPDISSPGYAPASSAVPASPRAEDTHAFRVQSAAVL